MPLPDKLSLSWSCPKGDPRMLTAVVDVFHSWISGCQLEETLIDVADYRHVPRGPGIVLIGLAHNYGLRAVEHGLEFYCDEKRREQSSMNPLTRLLGTTARAGRLLEKELDAPGLIDTSKIVVSARERLYPNYLAEEFSWHVRQALAPALWTVPTVRPRTGCRLPTVEAEWVAERNLVMIDERYSDKLATSEELRA